MYERPEVGGEGVPPLVGAVVLLPLQRRCHLALHRNHLLVRLQLLQFVFEVRFSIMFIISKILLTLVVLDLSCGIQFVKFPLAGGPLLPIQGGRSKSNNLRSHVPDQKCHPAHFTI